MLKTEFFCGHVLQVYLNCWYLKWAQRDGGRSWGRLVHRKNHSQIGKCRCSTTQSVAIINNIASSKLEDRIRNVFSTMEWEMSERTMPGYLLDWSIRGGWVYHNVTLHSINPHIFCPNGTPSSHGCDFQVFTMNSECKMFIFRDVVRII